MNEWITTVAAAAIIISLISMLLPKSNIKNTAMLAFGILFVFITVTPVIKFLSTGTINLTKVKIENEIEAAAIKEATGKNDEAYILKVIDEYKSRLMKETEKSLSTVSEVQSADLNIEINENYNDKKFGEVTKVECKMRLKEDNQTESKIKPVDRISRIEITLKGIKAVNDYEKEQEETKNLEEEAVKKDVLNQITTLLGVKSENVVIEVVE